MYDDRKELLHVVLLSISVYERYMRHYSDICTFCGTYWDTRYIPWDSNACICSPARFTVKHKKEDDSVSISASRLRRKNYLHTSVYSSDIIISTSCVVANERRSMTLVAPQHLAIDEIIHVQLTTNCQYSKWPGVSHRQTFIFFWIIGGNPMEVGNLNYVQ